MEDAIISSVTIAKASFAMFVMKLGISFITDAEFLDKILRVKKQQTDQERLRKNFNLQLEFLAVKLCEIFYL